MQTAYIPLRPTVPEMKRVRDVPVETASAPEEASLRAGALQRIALILVRVTSVHLLTQVLYKKTADAVTPSTGPITMKSAVGTANDSPQKGVVKSVSICELSL